MLFDENISRTGFLILKRLSELFDYDKIVLYGGWAVYSYDPTFVSVDVDVMVPGGKLDMYTFFEIVCRDGVLKELVSQCSNERGWDDLDIGWENDNKFSMGIDVYDFGRRPFVYGLNDFRSHFNTFRVRDVTWDFVIENSEIREIVYGNDRTVFRVLKKPILFTMKFNAFYDRKQRGSKNSFYVDKSSKDIVDMMRLLSKMNKDEKNRTLDLIRSGFTRMEIQDRIKLLERELLNENSYTMFLVKGLGLRKSDLLKFVRKI